jgi:hypothetical protein
VLDAYARRRQALEGSLMRAAIASELDELDRYDVVLYLSRSGTTSDLLTAHQRFAGRVREVAIVGDPDTPLPRAVDATVLMPFADERSVVQTRFATTALVLLRHSLGERLDRAIADGEAALADELAAAPMRFDHLVVAAGLQADRVAALAGGGALIGAAIGAGLGLLASRAFDEDDMAGMMRSARKRAGRAVRRRAAAAAKLGTATSRAIGGASESVGDFASHAREAFEDALRREIRDLRKAARRRRRRLGL